MNIPFTRPSITEAEKNNVLKALETGVLKGNGEFTKKCEKWIDTQTGSKSLLVHSCTAALEMAALLMDLKPGDEVIMPSYTFVSTANPVVLRGATPVFVDIREDTLNIDEKLIADAITPKTKAISVVHYAGVGAEMDPIMKLAKEKNLLVCEDAAQGVMASYRGRPLGSIGHYGALSFHDTKNLVSGEGGALLINDKSKIFDAEVIREKGTNRTSYQRKEVAFYTWVGPGSSYICSEILASLLLAQFDRAKEIQSKRHKVWEAYFLAFADLEQKGLLRRPKVPQHCQHNAHIFYLIAPTNVIRERIIKNLGENDVTATFHYIPLHNSPAGKKYGRAHGALPLTIDLSERLVRLPIIPELADYQGEIEKIIDIVKRSL